MSKSFFPATCALCVFFGCLGALPALAEEPDLQDEMNRLERRLNEQEKLVEEQQHMLDVQAEEIGKQKKKIEALTSVPTPAEKKKPSMPAKESALPQNLAPRAGENLVPQAGGVIVAPPADQPRVEENEELRPQIEAIADQGGILSPRGSLTYENTLEYTNTTRNLFAFNGVELAQVVLVGGITASSARHQIVQETGRLRLGVTDRLEADVHAPFVYRNDNMTNTASTMGTMTTSVEGANLGDVDAGIAYQFNSGSDGWPFLIGNLRYKANNADGPFDVPYDANNIAKRLPAGTGFQTAEASVTAIKISDPAVLFGNIGYVYDVPRDIDKNFNGVYVGHVKPGDAINALVGMGFAINQDTSFSLGYKHSFIFPTFQKTTAGGVTINESSGSSQVGALTLGLSYALSPATSLNFNVEAGVTNDAPDVHLIFRVPFLLGKVY